ncbi:MAG: RNA polymerase sigma factor RpoD/SigA [Spirochaetes bacterium]|nr:RNA polymerase sigma factor RpoD/SigA [Spirochaetota bacterium]
MSKTYQNKNTLKYYFDIIKNNPLLTAEEEKYYAKKIEEKSQDAFNRMVRCNLRLVVKIAKKYMTPEWQLEDLIQEGNIGLIKAVEKFDYHKGVRFSTYASWWIKQAIIRSISNKRRTIRLPHRKEEKLRKINKAINELNQKFHRNPTIQELAEYLGYKEINIINLINVSETLISIDADINEEGCNLINTINDEKYSPERLFNKEQLITETDKVLERLKAKEKYILKKRFAFEDNKKETLKSIAQSMGISPETVRQIEIKTLNRIKNEYSYLKEYLNA